MARARFASGIADNSAKRNANTPALPSPRRQDPHQAFNEMLIDWANLSPSDDITRSLGYRSLAALMVSDRIAQELAS